MTELLPPKKEVALALLERSNVDVYLDPRAKGVVVPPQFRKEPRLILKIGLNMPVPIPDLRVDDDSMSCTLSFNRSPFYCIVPWSAVFAMVGEDGRGMVWPDDVPQELAVKVVEPSEGDDPRAQASSRPERGAGGAPPSPAAASGGRRGRGAARERPTDDVAVAESPAAERKAGAGKRKKKKDDAPSARPVLVAVPSPDAPAVDGARARAARDADADGRGKSAPSERPREIRQPPGSRRPPPRDGVSAVPSSRPRQPAPPSDGQARPKRELPPYLRVVK